MTDENLPSLRLRSLAFAGYRSFTARSPAAANRELEVLTLAPLTILLGKNNSGKSTVGRLVHHALLALGADGKDPFPMGDGQRSYGTRFREIQHGGFFFNPLDLKADLYLEDGATAAIEAQLMQRGELDDDNSPALVKWNWNGTDFNPEVTESHGLLPADPSADRWRQGARRLLAGSCHIGPVREPIRRSYDVGSKRPASGLPDLPDSGEAVARLLHADDELRGAVGRWTAKHLERWRLDIQQNLGVFSLRLRRDGREVNLADAGQGVQQVLQIAVLCCWRSLQRRGAPFVDFVEQPELHLHDAAHAALGDLLLSAVSTGRGHMIVETHSEALVLRIRRRIAEGLLSTDQVAMFYVEDVGEGSRLRPIPLLADGDVQWWPEGVFSEAFEEVKALRRAQRGREAA